MNIPKGSVMVYIEVDKDMPIKSSLEILTPARQIADSMGTNVTALIIGDSAQSVRQTAAYAEQVIYVEDSGYTDYHPDIYSYIINTILDKYQPSVLIMGGTRQGKELAARCAHYMKTGVISDVTAHSVDENNIVTWTVPVYGGTILHDIRSEKAPVQIAVIRSGAYKKPDFSLLTNSPTVMEKVVVPSSFLHLAILKSVQEISENINLEDAEIIVSGGRGMGNAENFALVEELARVLGGVTGATRPAIEAGWVSRAHQVGQSGKIVSPKLYIACGISGATQHVSGMAGSGFVVAVNKDEDAPIFDIADIGIVGNVADILPVMIDEIKKLRQ